MKREIVKVANDTERKILAPHIEAHRVMTMAAAAIARNPALQFEPDGCYWWRPAAEKAESFNEQEPTRGTE